MLIGNRGRFHTVVTLLFSGVVAVFILITTWDLAALNTRYRQEAEQSAKEYADRIQERIAAACPDRNSIPLAKCAAEIIDSTKEAQTAQRDLAAQRSMALWATAMFWVTAASVGITGVGIYFVWRTLDANTAAVEQATEANRIMREDRRAWISFTVSTPVPWKLDNGHLQGGFNLQFENIGGEPAYNCRILTKLISDRGYHDGHNRLAITELISKSLKYYSRFKFIMPRQKRIDYFPFIQKIDEDHFLPRVYILVAYRTKSSAKELYTFMSFDSMLADSNISKRHSFSGIDRSNGFEIILRDAHSEMAI